MRMICNLRHSALLTLAGLIAAMPALAEPEAFETPRTDGSNIHWSLDIPDTKGKTGLIVLAQGSGCLPAMQSRSMQQPLTIFEGFPMRCGTGSGLL